MVQLSHQLPVFLSEDGHTFGGLPAVPRRDEVLLSSGGSVLAHGTGVEGARSTAGFPCKVCQMD